MDKISINFTQEQMDQILAEGKDELVAAAVQAIRDRINWAAKDCIAAQIKPIVEKFVQEEIVPELVEQLVGQKSVILAGVVAQANDIGAAFVQALVDQVAKTLGDSYSRKKVFEALFK